MRSPFAAVLLAVALPVLGAALWLRGEPERALAEREARWGARIEPGDLVFQDLACGERCDLIRAVTRSPYVHVGIVFREWGERVVWEALGPPVDATPLPAWIARGRGGRVAVYRLPPEVRARLDAVHDAVRALRGQPYDPDYQWDDARIYCSELVVKAVNRAMGTEVFAPHVLGREALGFHAAAAARLSGGRLTEYTTVFSPADLARSPRLVRVRDELLAPP